MTPRSDPGRGAWFSGPGGLLDRPLTSYYLVLGCSMLLLALGMVMVLSASSIQPVPDTGSAFTLFEKQALWVAIGLPLMWLGGAAAAPGLPRAGLPADAAVGAGPGGRAGPRPRRRA